MDDTRALRGQGRWDEALELTDDPFERADDARRLLEEAKRAAEASGASAFGARIDAALTGAAES